MEFMHSDHGVSHIACRTSSSSSRDNLYIMTPLGKVFNIGGYPQQAN